jgi:hypothetical protein
MKRWLPMNPGVHGPSPQMYRNTGAFCGDIWTWHGLVCCDSSALWREGVWTPPPFRR